ncbi:MAG: hypothetical protein AB8B73_00495 [Ekhidna sp.]
MSAKEISLSTSYPSIRIFKSPIASLDFEQIANETIYGTPGRMRYEHTKSTEKIKSIKNTSFLEFKRNNTTLGIIALVRHQLNIGDQPVSGLYVRYFSFNAPMRSEGEKTQKNRKKPRVIHQAIKELFDHPETLVLKPLSDKTIIYAFVESTNEHSLNMVKAMDFLPSRKLVTLLFSRFYPKKKLNIIRLPEERNTEMNSLLKSFYKNYNLVHNFNESWDNYFIHEVNGKIIFGAKLEVNSWKIHEMPGLDGWLFRKVLPRLPILNRIFQKGKIDFIGVERLYVNPSHEHLLPNFLETLCSQYEVTKAMMGVDNQSPIHSLLKTQGKLGLLDRLITPSPGILFKRTFGLTKQEELSLDVKPFYVSTYDMS